MSISLRPPIDYQRQKLLKVPSINNYADDFYKGNPLMYDYVILTDGVLLTYILIIHYLYFCDPPSLLEILERIKTRGLDTTLLDAWIK